MNAQSTAQRCAFPDKWVDSLFDRLEAAYGSKWLNMWGHTKLPNVKSLWAEKLSGFVDNPGSITFALNALDEHPFPPTLPEFIALCRKAPQPKRQTLPAPEPDKQKIEAAALEARRVTAGKQDPVGWAKRPRSQYALDAVIDLAKRGDTFFAGVLDALREAGRVDGNKLVQRWDGQQWLSA